MERGKRDESLRPRKIDHELRQAGGEEEEEEAVRPNLGKRLTEGERTFLEESIAQDAIQFGKMADLW